MKTLHLGDARSHGPVATRTLHADDNTMVGDCDVGCMNIRVLCVYEWERKNKEVDVKGPHVVQGQRNEI